MDRILINVTIPLIEKTYDMFVPARCRIGKLVEIISNGVKELSDGKFVPSGDEQLVCADPEMLPDPQNTMFDYGFSDGSRFFLI